MNHLTPPPHPDKAVSLPSTAPMPFGCPSLATDAWQTQHTHIHYTRRGKMGQPVGNTFVRCQRVYRIRCSIRFISSAETGAGNVPRVKPAQA